MTAWKTFVRVTRLTILFAVEIAIEPIPGNNTWYVCLFVRLVLAPIYGLHPSFLFSAPVSTQNQSKVVEVSHPPLPTAVCALLSP